MKRPDRVLDAAGAPTAEFLAWSRSEHRIPDDWVWYWCENGCGEIVWCPPGLPSGVVKACSTRCVIEVTRKIGEA